MKGIIVNKPKGITPLQTINELKALGFFAGRTLSYAGRLDPMASGLLPIVRGDMTDVRNELLNLRKTYTVKIIRGASSDSGDAFGVVTEQLMDKKITHGNFVKKLNELRGNKIYKIPHYSSVVYDSKPLHEHARNGGVVDLYRTMFVENAEMISIGEVAVAEIVNEISSARSTLNGSWRFDLILESYKRLSRKSLEYFEVRFDVGSGTYIRSLVEKIGEELGVLSLAYDIKREKVGEFSQKDETFLQQLIL